MDFALFYTLAAVVAYFLAVWILDRIEVAYGKRFAYRNYIFFFILFGLAYVALIVINPNPEPELTPPERQQLQGIIEKPAQYTQHE